MPTIIEMVTCTRLDCAVASAGLMRLTLANAIHHCRHRTVFQKHLVDQPLMTQVLADLALDVEAATALSFRLARSFDRASDEHAAAWRRLMTPVTKYWVCKIGPALAYEAMECLGGNGYVEEGMAARLYRELPLNAIWEGSGNVMALDLLRVLQREPETVEIVMDDLAARVGGGRAPQGASGARAGAAARAAAARPARPRPGRGAGDAGGRHHPARACAHRRGRRLHRHAALRRPAPDLRPGARLGRYARHRRPGAADVRLTLSPQQAVTHPSRDARNGSGPRVFPRARIIAYGEQQFYRRAACRLMAFTISPRAPMKGSRSLLVSTESRRWSTRAAAGFTELRAAWPFWVRRTAYMRASRRVRLRCSRPFLTSRRTMSASVERSTPVYSTRPVWLMSGF